MANHIVVIGIFNDTNLSTIAVAERIADFLRV
jgi:hypothetical protein